jgi:3-deoxy-D-manno-octulosonic-acid transferase
VGEVNVIQPLVDKLGFPPDRLVVSTTTDTGQALAQKLFSQKARLCFFPLDWQWACRRYLRAATPRLVLMTETELWPGFLAAARGMGVPVMVINGRISDRSYRRYRLVRPFLRRLLPGIAEFCMRSAQDVERIVSLGAPSGRVRSVGNLKYDYELPPDSDKHRVVQAIDRLLRPTASSVVWLCGSTRENEEALLAGVFERLRGEFPQLRWLVAPRHPHRAEEVATLLSNRGFRVARRSMINPEDSPSDDKGDLPDCLLLDSIGELAYLYQIADVVFIGGSLVPWGGHNVIEAANFGKAILFGPYMQNFRDVAGAFLAAGAAVQVSSADDLALRMRELLKDPEKRGALGAKAQDVIRANRGALERTLRAIQPYYDELKAPR